MASYCERCNKLVDTTKQNKQITHNVKGVEITINADVCVCKECGEEVGDEDTDTAILREIYTEYRKLKGLLNPTDIKRIREQYGVSQVVFAKILGLGEKTIARYENGSIQDEAQNNLILLAANFRNFLQLFEKNKLKLSETELQQVRERFACVEMHEPVIYCIDCLDVKYDYSIPKSKGAIYNSQQKASEGEIAA
ncbi:hypothetical protein SDC9_69314 [bioreactor metagenome]|uniref:HTH cro/C1-type domain-containing protein n=1 Tax=bioreactor metagenome TaxID=1076179 RepID=A0A644Y2T9_9ZZZZ